MNLLFFYLDLLFDLRDSFSLHGVDLFLNFLEFLLLFALHYFNFLCVLVWLEPLDHDIIIGLGLSKPLKFLSCHLLEAFLNLSLLFLLKGLDLAVMLLPGRPDRLLVGLFVHFVLGVFLLQLLLGNQLLHLPLSVVLGQRLTGGQ